MTEQDSNSSVAEEMSLDEVSTAHIRSDRIESNIPEHTPSTSSHVDGETTKAEQADVRHALRHLQSEGAVTPRPEGHRSYTL